MKQQKVRWPNTNWGWHRYYVSRFNKTEHYHAEYLAMLYLLFHLAFDTERITIGEQQYVHL